MTTRKAKAALIYRLFCLLISVGGIVLHLLADHRIQTGFMVRHKLAYFTIQTNIMAALLFAVLLFRSIKDFRKEGKWIVSTVSPGLYGALTFYITMTMLGFWGLLAPTTGIPSDSFLLMNTLILHLVTPLLTLADFLLFFPHGHLHPRHAALWLSYPAGYLFLVMLYSRFIQEPYYSFQIQGRTIDLMYPYPFLDKELLGVTGVMIAVIVITAVFYAIARLFVFTDRKISEIK